MQVTHTHRLQGQRTLPERYQQLPQGIYSSRKVVWEEEENCPLGRLKTGSSKVPSVRGRFWGPTPASRTLTQEPPGWYVLLSYVQMRYKGLREKSGDVETCRTARCERPFKTFNTQLQDNANVQHQQLWQEARVFGYHPRSTVTSPPASMSSLRWLYAPKGPFTKCDHI